MSVTSESRRDRMQVLVDGKWVDVGGTVQGFTFDETTAIVDEVPPMQTSFSMTMPIDPEAGASLLRFIRGRALAERANRRLWLRAPLPPRPMLCGRLPMRLT
ncbi:hypothetical protein PBI_APPA_65 [Microbacterium phage Appa]|uniref:Uncharacterized protein n=1 Tax=Microbacterium phage Appa TaxID=2182350 RepID=A0A2U8UIG0_9CAUD|nr:hypothetical protein HOT26_gp49 [Microbacterium phage Appa]AWN03246.1 hypothetical protein PBI_APPA_65 [Microbacterium phage Appa]